MLISALPREAVSVFLNASYIPSRSLKGCALRFRAWGAALQHSGQGQGQAALRLGEGTGGCSNPVSQWLLRTNGEERTAETRKGEPGLREE